MPQLNKTFNTEEQATRYAWIIQRFNSITVSQHGYSVFTDRQLTEDEKYQATACMSLM